MNILIPHHWLREHLETTATPAQIQEHLSRCGPAVEQIHNHQGESVYDIEVTTNRVDSMSVRGIAREAAVILRNAGLSSQLQPLALPDIVTPESPLPLPEIKMTPELCHRVTALVMDNVGHPATPTWMAERLHQVALNVKDSVIDITNYLTHDLGHPCHVFDYDKIMALGGQIAIATARASQTFTTLHHETYTCQGGEVVFVNPAGEIIDLPGIIGTANSVVDEHTRRILFWIESIPAALIRQTSMTHGIRTPAAVLNERELDHNLAPLVARRAVTLYTQITGARVASALYDQVLQPIMPAEIVLTNQEINRYLGLSLPLDQVATMLTQLGCTVTPRDPDTLAVTAPTFRTDLAIPADLVEEIARIYGYHNLPSVLMPTAIPTTYPENTDFALEDQVKQLLADLGYQELYTYSLISQELAAPTPPGLDQHLALKNPLTSDLEYLRRHILPSHVALMRAQLSRTGQMGTFELAHTYEPQAADLPHEHLTLAILGSDFRALRTTLEILGHRLHGRELQLKIDEGNTKNKPSQPSFYRQSAFIILDDQVLGRIGYLDDGLVGAELDWTAVLHARRRWPEYRPIPKTAPYYEDWTLQIPENTPVGHAVDTIATVSPWVDSVTWRDQYAQNWTFRVSLLDRERQMTSERAQAVRQEAQTKLAAQGITLLT